MIGNILEGEYIKKIINGIVESEENKINEIVESKENKDEQNYNNIFEIIICFLIVRKEMLMDETKGNVK